MGFIIIFIIIIIIIINIIKVSLYGYVHLNYITDSRQLPLNHFQQVINGTLTIQTVQKPQDEGKYTCMAFNTNGKGTQRSVFVRVVGKPYNQFTKQNRTEKDTLSS